LNKEEKPPTRKAVALRYIPEKDQAPKVTAKGSGYLAEKILELAKQHGIPIKEDPALIQILSKLDLYQEIPPAIYVVIAEILAFVYRTNHQRSRPAG
jgi:flagellar biosynthesis protein